VLSLEEVKTKTKMLLKLKLKYIKFKKKHYMWQRFTDTMP